VVAASDERARRLRERRGLAGATPGALEAYLAVRGMRTLALRLQRASGSAAELAERLAGHAGVAVVRYPGRQDHPTHATARSFMAGFGAVVSFDVKGGAERADAVCRSVRIIRHATSLGGVERPSNAEPPLPARPTFRPGCCGSASDANIPTTSGATSNRPSRRDAAPQPRPQRALHPRRLHRPRRRRRGGRCPA
jgi:cystathionine gamma-synthase